MPSLQSCGVGFVSANCEEQGSRQTHNSDNLRSGADGGRSSWAVRRRREPLELVVQVNAVVEQPRRAELLVCEYRNPEVSVSLRAQLVVLRAEESRQRRSRKY